MASSYPPAEIESNGWSEAPMSENRLRSLNSLCPKLETNIIVNNFLSSVHCDAGGFLNDRERQVIDSKGSNFEKVRELISILKGKDNASFDKFCSVLVSVRYGHWARKLLEQAGIPCEWVQDSLSLPREKLNDILLNKKKVFHPEEEELHSRFVDLTGNFEEYVYSLQDIKFRVFRRHCSGFLQNLRAGPLGPSPDLPHDKGPLLDLLNREWNFIDVRLFSDLVDRSNHRSLQEDMEKYKQSLERFSSQKLSQLEKSIQAKRDSGQGEGLEDSQILAVILSKDPTLKEIFKIKEFLVNYLRLDNAKFLGFDSGCTVLFFAVSSRTSAKPSRPSIEMLAYLRDEFSACRILMLGLWVLEISPSSGLPGVYELQKLNVGRPAGSTDFALKEDLDQLTEEVRNIKDQVVNIKLEQWEQKRQSVVFQLDKDIKDSPPPRKETQATKDNSDSPGFFRRLFRRRQVKKKRNQPSTVTSESFTQTEVGMEPSVPHPQPLHLPSMHTGIEVESLLCGLHPRERHTSGSSDEVAYTGSRRYSKQPSSLPSHDSRHDSGSHSLAGSYCLDIV
jgi:hypothetical protein